MNNLASIKLSTGQKANMWDLLFSKAGLVAITLLVWFIASPTFRCIVLAIFIGDFFFGDDGE